MTPEPDPAPTALMPTTEVMPPTQVMPTAALPAVDTEDDAGTGPSEDAD